MMKYLLKVLLVTVFYMTAFSSNAISDIDEIFLDKEAKSLIAPEGCKYQWYHNNRKAQGAQFQEIKVTEPGHYKVEITDENGIVTNAEVRIAVDAAGAIIKIYLIGDSTVCNYSASDYPMTGWGQVLSFFFNAANIQIENRAIGGRSSRSFYEQGRWTPIKDALVSGDFVFIQFGHNDRDYSKAERYTSVADYKKFLTTYCNDTKAKGATPVLVSPMVMNAWSGTTMRNVFTESGNDYRGAMLEVATTLNVPFVDLNMKSWNLYKGLGKDYITRFVYHTYLAGEYPNYPDGITDGTHFQEMGAIENARMIVQGINELSARKEMQPLIQNLKPQYEIAVTADPASAALFTTRTATYPQGLTVTLKTIPKTAGTFQKWNNAMGNSVGTTLITTVKSGTAATSYKAIYPGAVNCSATITPAGSQKICDGEFLTLSAGAAASYIWKKDGAQVGTGATYKVTSAGSYVAELTFPNGCKAVSAPVSVSMTAPSVWYADTDGDGKGDPAVSKTACVQPAGYVGDKTDLCAGDPAKINPGNCGCGKTEQSCLDCNGVVNGTAVKDDCDRCVGGNTGKIKCASAAEAEILVCNFDGVQETSNAGFKGTSYLNTTNVTGAYIHFNILSSATGPMTIGFRYASGSTGNRQAAIHINGIASGKVFDFPSTGGFTTWKTIEQSVDVQQGRNAIDLIASGAEGLANIDQILLISDGLSQDGCIITGYDPAVQENLTVVYADPVSGNFKMISKGAFGYCIYDNSGIQKFSGNAENSAEVNADLPEGIYLIGIQTGETIKYFKVVKAGGN
jgi:lysophospholipase L1-like esterase